ncbi:MarR family winged helix-turn-helix transcriptional regulator [Cellulomonas telluris]|uniref:MarR family winged helix-turn-helix transcriptional regulator n=1 Tax=Cellulomonas telluris TaxID=2306636 RepID=UPI001FE3CD44|nr:MarR family transcriptional regulator [Cellulomonas telluris]
MSDTTQGPIDHWPVGRLLSAAARRMEREWNAHLAAWDLNHASHPVLVHLTARDMSQRELAEACGVTEQTMSRVLARLERTGYVSRRPDPDDRRRHVIAITAAGTAAFLASADPEPAQERVLEPLDDRQRAQLRDLLLLVVRPDRSVPAPGGRPGAGEDGDDASARA